MLGATSGDIARIYLIEIVFAALAGSLAGLAGGLWAHDLGVVKPVDMSLDRSLFFLIYLAVGGIEHWAGALLGTLTLGMLPELLRFSREYRLAFFGLLLTGIMVLHPSGFLSRQAIRWMAQRLGRMASSLSLRRD